MRVVVKLDHVIGYIRQLPGVPRPCCMATCSHRSAWKDIENNWIIWLVL